MFTLAQTSHAPALFRPTTLTVVADRPAAVLYLEARGWTIIACDFDGDDAADIAATKGGADLELFTVERITLGKD